jgi:hypothetical protein
VNRTNSRIRLVLNSPTEIDRIAFSKLEKEGFAEIAACLIWEPKENIGWNELFAGAELIDNSLLVRNGLAADYSGVDQRFFTPELQSQIAWAENITLEMMDRMDSLKSLTYFQRKNLYKYLVCFWAGKIEALQPEVFYSKLTPHEVSDFVLFVLCKTFGIKVIFFNYTAFHGHVIVSNDYRHPWPRLMHELDSRRDASGAFVGEATIHNEKARAYLDRLKAEYDLAKPKYEVYYDLVAPKKRKDLFNIRAGLIGFSRKAKQFIRMSVFTLRSLYEKKPLFTELINYVKWIVIKRETTELKELYNQAQVKHISMDEPYVYFPLSFQPEMTTSPQGGIFADQHMAISLLSKAIPDHWKIYVKEHPGQFRTGEFYTYAYNGREKTYYQRLLAIPKVSLIPITAEHFQLLDKAVAVGTITGTVGWESAVRSKPAIIFGDIWYRYAPNVYRINTLEDCIAAIDSVQSGQIASAMQMNSFVNALLAASDRIFFDHLDAKWAEAEFDLGENADRLYDVIRKEISG